MTSSARITLTESDDLRILEIRNVTPQDSGVYKITLENNVGKVEASARLEVITHRPTSSRSLRARSLSPNYTPTRTWNSSLRYGNNARLFYDIRSVPTSFLKYYRSNIEESANSLTFATNHNNFDNLCQNSNSLNTIKTDDEKLGPKITHMLPKTLNAIEGEQMELQLKVTGSLPFYVNWMKDGCILVECDKFEFISKDGLIILIVTKPSAKDSGCYTCLVYNDFGQISSSCHVSVYGKFVSIIKFD